MDDRTNFIIDNLPFNEKKAIAELRNRLAEDLDPQLKDDDRMFLRFLRARDFNLDKSEDMLRKHLTWRRMINLQDFVPPAVATKYVPLSSLGFDKDGAPLRYFSFGDLDGKGILKSCKKMDVIKTVLLMLEDDVKEMKTQSERLGKPLEQWTYIFNFDKFGLAKATHKPTLELLISIFMMYEANYPERLKAAFAINASVYFAITFSFIKPLLSGATLKKLKIFGTDDWQEELLKAVDVDVLPKFLGGTRTDPNGSPLCTTVVKAGGNVPEEYYVTKQGCALAKEPDVKKINVSRMSKYHVQLEVAEAASFIEWEFETESKDIGFGLYYREFNEGSKMKEIIPKQRIEAHISAEVGMYKCEKPGFYTLVFDNSYSWLQQKEIFCRAAVVTPSGQRVSAFK